LHEEFFIEPRADVFSQDSLRKTQREGKNPMKDIDKALGPALTNRVPSKKSMGLKGPSTNNVLKV
jgi:hypothetical protein